MLRHTSMVALAIVAAGCFNLARLDRALPPSVEALPELTSIEIANESGAVFLRGQFSAPTTDGAITSRVATLAGSESSPAGSATLEVATLDDGGFEETLHIDIAGLRHPSLYRVRIDDREVTVFSAATSDQVSIYLSRRTEGR